MPPDVLVWQSPSWVMNPSLSKSLVERAFDEDPDRAGAEYGAQWRRDVERYVSVEAVRACVVKGRHELRPEAAPRYYGFVDPSGGQGDSMTMAIAHRDFAVQQAVLDCVREWRPPFDPELVVAECAWLCQQYGIRLVRGDAYAGVWVSDAFKRNGVGYKPSKLPKSGLYAEFLPTLNTGAIELLDHPKLVAQICGLERRTARSGRDSIDHQPGGHDDLANAVAGVSFLVKRRRPQQKGVSW